MSSYKMKAQITLPLARVTNTLEFTNTNQKTLAGEFIFPLPEEATLVGYALDVDGVLIDAVPIEKEKAKAVFEDEVRSHGAGVSIVQQVANSNAFKTSIYPLHHNTKRTVQVTYTIPVTCTTNSSEVQLPLLYAQGASVSAQVEWNYADPQKDLSVELVKPDNQSAAVQSEPIIDGSKKTIVISEEILTNVNSLLIRSNETQQDNQVTVEGEYFCARMKVEKPQVEKEGPSKVQIVYDTSYSRRDQLASDSDLLKKILEKKSCSEFVLSTFSITPQASQTFANVSSLMSALSKIIFDGATNLDNLESILDDSCDYCIVFTDGQHTLGRDVSPSDTYSVPMYILSTSTKSNSQLLSHIATKSGGAYFNATTPRHHDAIISQIAQPILYFLTADYEQEEFEQVYPNEPVPVDKNGYFCLYGKVKNITSGQITCMFKYGSQSIPIIQVDFPKIESNKKIDPKDNITAQLWAKQKMNSLSAFPQLFSDEMKQLSFEWKISSPNTSLIVLSTLEQYLKHKIKPNQQLSFAKEYDRKVNQQQLDVQKEQDQKIERVLEMWKSRVQWYQTDFAQKIQQEKERIQKEKEKAKEEEKRKKSQQSSSSQQDDIMTCSMPRMRMAAPSGCAPMAMRSSMAMCAPRSESLLMESACDLSLPPPPPSSSQALSASVPPPGNNAALSTSASVPPPGNNAAPSTSATIKVNQWTSQEPYMDKIKNSQDPYRTYLELRRELSNSPAFFLDVADYFLTQSTPSSSPVGLNILTNLLELELDSEQLYRIVAYRLDQERQFEWADYLFTKVLSMRPDEPQSYRDLALVKEKMNQLEQAADLLNQVIYKKWDSRFDEIEVTAIIELNHVLFKNKSLPICNEGFRQQMDLDLRISMAWDTNDTDVDLHVEEVTELGQQASYSNRNTMIGGHVSRDFRQGYGPEEYMLRVAPKGSYKVAANYFSNHQQSLHGGTTVLLTFFTNYMRPNEKSETITVRLVTTANRLPVCTIDV
ncbi:vault and TPR domain protein [Acrasis kona]|uniref:Vault and TPR domain protein n=1 Tax=Acrasis kona TaxID=1008807 RepID=A0AAW2ZM40_9EUKA